MVPHGLGDIRQLAGTLLLGVAILCARPALAQLPSAYPPAGGSAPATQMTAFDRQDVNCSDLLNKSMQGNGLRVDAVSPIAVVGQNSAVAAAITCFQKGNTRTWRIMIVTASTDKLTSLWYRDDLQIRVEQALNHAPITGSGNCPTTGNAVVLSYAPYSATNSAIAAANYIKGGYRDKKLNMSTGLSPIEFAGSNAQAWVIMNTIDEPPVNDRALTRGVVIAVSTDSAVATWYRDALRKYPNSVGL